MIFRRTNSIYIILVLSIFNLVFGSHYLDQDLFELIVGILLMFFFYLVTTFIKVENGLIKRHSIFIIKKTIIIKELGLIEAVRIRKAGVIYIRIGNSVQEEYYILHGKNNIKIKIDSKYRRRGYTLGQFLIKEYKIPHRETEKIKYSGVRP
ncbi:hypothetical protein [Cohnella boryungensis]|uniref:DUF304 domain-containing protein n=1 Tax=Cohnella boryungensis TaxID=768479 RepID=A0ABV8SG12_9BACL